jgi:hypothetical protein
LASDTNFKIITTGFKELHVYNPVRMDNEVRPIMARRIAGKPGE